MWDNLVKVDVLDSLKPKVFEMSQDTAQRLINCHFCSIRLEAGEGAAAVALDGDPKGTGFDWGLSIGATVIAGDTMRAPGYFGIQLGADDVKNGEMEKIAKRAITEAYTRAIYSARLKSDLAQKYPGLGKTIWSTELAPVEIYQDTYHIPFKVDPREIDPRDVLTMMTDISKKVASYEEIKMNQQYITLGITRKVFVSSEGACIDQLFPLVQYLTVVATHPEGKTRSIYYDCMGERAGWEVVSGDNCYGQTAYDFGIELAERAKRLNYAPVLPTSEKEEVVIYESAYGALTVHEIVGHPVELDRILKLETGYAGRSRFFKSLHEHQMGKQIASPLVTAFSDPTIPGYGHYKYDDEGVKGRRVVHINEGRLTPDFLNSRQTASIFQHYGFDVEPNGAMRAVDAVCVPLIRMNNTCFAPGDRDPEDIIKEVDHGYYFNCQRVPSISESRENFRISAEEVWEIENGELTTLYRDGSISADSEQFLKNVDAVGNDFKNIPVFNCGKGEPMQPMKVGNGSPTMRSRAKVVGSHAAK